MFHPCAPRPAVLEACREMLTNKDSYYPRRTDWPAEEGVYIDLTVPAEAANPKIPKVIRDLRPGYVIIQKDSVWWFFKVAFLPSLQGISQRRRR